MDRVIVDSWHKFVYYDEDNKDLIKDIETQYFAKIDSDEPIVVYISNEGLPKIKDRVEIDRYKIEFFHRRYYEILILKSIIDTLMESIDIDILNSRFKRLFHLCLMSDDIDDVVELRDILDKCMNTYKREYINYIETGILGDFYNELEIPNVIIDLVIPCIKKSIGLKKYFCLLIDVDKDLSIYNQMAINDYIASRCTGYLSINVLLSKYNWDYYYSSNFQLIENVHDYFECDLRKSYNKKYT